MHSLPQLTPGKSIYWFFNQGQAASPCYVSESLGAVHLRNTPKTKVNKTLRDSGRRGALPVPPTGKLLQETCRRASSSVSLSKVKTISAPTMAKPTRNPHSWAFGLSARPRTASMM